MPITLFDGLLIGLMLVSGVLAMIRGFSRELLSIGSWIAAAVAAFFFYPKLAPIVAPYTAQVTSSKTVADIAAAGYRVVGDLDDLAVDPTDERTEALTDAEVLDVALGTVRSGSSASRGRAATGARRGFAGRSRRR